MPQQKDQARPVASPGQAGVISLGLVLLFAGLARAQGLNDSANCYPFTVRVFWLLGWLIGGSVLSGFGGYLFEQRKRLSLSLSTLALGCVGIGFGGLFYGLFPPC